MLYKETICKSCNGYGFITEATENSISSRPCPAHCHEGRVVVPMTNGDVIRRCSDEQLQLVYHNLKNNAIYSSSPVRLLFDSEPEDFKEWLQKETDDLDLRVIFDFLHQDAYRHPYLEVAKQLKYVIDVDAFIECLDCVDSIRVNGDLYVAIPLLKEFIQRFPKEKVNSEYTEYNVQPTDTAPAQSVNLV